MDHELDTNKTVPGFHPLAPKQAKAAAAALLVQIYPPGQNLGSCLSLRRRPILIGRGEECDIRLRDSAVSRRHARIERQKGGFHVIDQESTNGTFLNDTAVTCAKLDNGDYLRIGETIFRFLAHGQLEAAYHEEVHRLIIYDGLTQIPNKRYFLEVLTRELGRAARYRRPLALAMIDIDHFKAVNDRYGHLGGDGVLRALAARVKPIIRKEDVFARYGGEEFALLLPETDKDGAAVLGERVRAAVEAHPFVVDGETIAITISVGLATAPGHPSLPAEDLIREADFRLYKAKGEGRNRVVT
jgi:diguanylate cyclase (GGDEF)-like protein